MGVILSSVIASWPFAIPNILFLIKHYHLAVLTWIPGKHINLPRVTLRPFLHYGSSVEEEQYWKSAARCRKILDQSNALQIPDEVPIVRYYAPRMLPTYRTHRVSNEAEYQLPAKLYCKWHRMIFPGPRHPTLSEAKERIRYFSNRDRREMRHITRLLSDKIVFEGNMQWTPYYRDIWREWLRSKGPDPVVIFA